MYTLPLIHTTCRLEAQYTVEVKNVRQRVVKTSKFIIDKVITNSVYSHRFGCLAQLV